MGLGRFVMKEILRAIGACFNQHAARASVCIVIFGLAKHWERATVGR